MAISDRLFAEGIVCGSKFKMAAWLPAAGAPYILTTPVPPLGDCVRDLCYITKRNLSHIPRMRPQSQGLTNKVECESETSGWRRNIIVTSEKEQIGVTKRIQAHGL